VSTRPPLGEDTDGPRTQAGMVRRDTARLRAMVVLLMLIVVSALGVWLILRLDAGKHAPQATPAACERVGRVLTKADIRIRVFNATTRNGLAASVAAQLRQRGYTVISVGNDDTSTVRGPAELRYGAAGSPAAKAVAGVVAGAASRPVPRAGSDVDLVLGNTFTRLAPPARQSPQAAASCPATAKRAG
jgi:hypothetical protein